MKVVDKVNKGQKISPSACPHTNAVIDETSEESWQWATVLAENLSFHVADKKARKARAHACSHGDSTCLLVVGVTELERIQCED